MMVQSFSAMVQALFKLQSQGVSPEAHVFPTSVRAMKQMILETHGIRVFARNMTAMRIFLAPDIDWLFLPGKSWGTSSQNIQQNLVGRSP